MEPDAVEMEENVLAQYVISGMRTEASIKGPGIAFQNRSVWLRANTFFQSKRGNSCKEIASNTFHSNSKLTENEDKRDSLDL